jgi:selenophosphate synthetase-related protein
MNGNEEYAKTIKNVLYTLDDNSAIEIDGKEIKVVSEGEWHKLNS